MKEYTEKEKNKRIKDLLYIQREICSRIYSEIDEVMRGRCRTNEEIKDSIDYLLEQYL